MVNYDGVGEGTVEMGAVTSGAEDLNDATQQVSTEQADSATSQEQTVGKESPWDGNQFALKYRDKPVIPESKEHLIKLAQLGYNNDLRMKQFDKRESTLAEREKALDNLKALSDAFDQRPEFKEAVLQIFQKMQNGQTMAAEQQADELPEGIQQTIAPYLSKIEQLEAKIQSIEGWKNQNEQSQADETVSKEIDELKSAFKDEDWDTPDSVSEKTLLREVIEHAAQNGFPTLKAAYKDLRFETAIANAKANGLKSADENAQKEARAGIVGKGGQGTPSVQKQLNIRNTNYSDLKELALAEMK